MTSLPGFPYEVGGTVTFKKRTTGWNGEEQQEVPPDVAALGQLLETAIHDQRQPGALDPEVLSRLVHRVIGERFRDNIETIHTARMVDKTLEIEFTAVGYAGRYMVYVSFEAAGGHYRVRPVQPPARVASSRSEWRGPACVAEALDGEGHVVGRATVLLEHDLGQGLVAHCGAGDLKDIEQAAEKIARLAVIRDEV